MNTQTLPSRWLNGGVAWLQMKPPLCRQARKRGCHSLNTRRPNATGPRLRVRGVQPPAPHRKTPPTTARPEVLSPFINVQQMRPETPRGATGENRRAHRKLKVIKDVRRRGRPPTEPPVTGGQAASRGNNGDHSNKRGLLLGSPSCADPERLLTPKADFGVS